MAVLESISVPTINGAPRDLRGLVNFGFWGWIARPLFLWLRWTFEKVVGNWGWAIVLQTLIINLALLPLRITGMKSALKMQKIQPQMKAIQEKYKKYGMRDPRRQDMNKEIWELQQREGVNMWGGCLPMLIQMPFLIAYYSMLGAAIDLRQAHWLWIHDLSSPEPSTIRILPILIVIADGVYATHDAAGRHGSLAAEDDECHDAGDVRVPQLERGFRSWSCIGWKAMSLASCNRRS